MTLGLWNWDAKAMSRLRRFLLTPVVVLLASLLSVNPVAGEGAYVIGASDVLEIQVWDNKDLNQVVFVRPDGNISLPLIGEIQAGGRTVQDLQGVLTGLYAKAVKDAVVTVIVKEIKSRPVYFIGAFAKPGVEQLTGDLRLVQAIAIAGGLLPTADGAKGFILRGAHRLPVDFTRLLQRGDVSQDVWLEPGDAVVVPLADAVYVQGEVKAPGAIKASYDLTVLRAVAQVGGVTPLAATSRVEIIRAQSEKKERITVDLDRIMKAPAENSDVRLNPNDIVFVPQRLF